MDVGIFYQNQFTIDCISYSLLSVVTTTMQQNHGSGKEATSKKLQFLPNQVLGSPWRSMWQWEHLQLNHWCKSVLWASAGGALWVEIVMVSKYDGDC